MVHLALLVLVILGLGALVFAPPRKNRIPTVGASRGEGDAGESAKSARSSATMRGSEELATTAAENLRRDRAGSFAAADTGLPGRTYVLPSRPELSPSTRFGKGDQLGIRSNPAPEGAARGGFLTGLSFAERARLHHQGRREYMKKRYEELASHLPGCKCAYHVGKK